MPICRFLLQAFTVVAVFNSMTFALKVTPLAVRALSEGAVAVKRFQVRKKINKTATHCCVFLFAIEQMLSFCLIHFSLAWCYSGVTATGVDVQCSKGKTFCPIAMMSAYRTKH